MATLPPLPDPKIPHGPYRPFTSDPGWSEAWWWLGIPLFVAAFSLGSYLAQPRLGTTATCCRKATAFWNSRISSFRWSVSSSRCGCYSIPSSGRGPSCSPCRSSARLSCLYIAGEEMSWGQHFFHWNTPEYWAEVNRQEETNLHNTYAIFEKTPRSILELSIALGGLGVPFAAIFYPWLRACRASLFLPANAMVPLAIGAMFFKVVDQAGARRPCRQAARPAERDDRDLSLCLHRRLSRHLRAADQGARSRARPSAEVTSSVVQRLSA